jgi:hypothetical protein
MCHFGCRPFVLRAVYSGVLDTFFCKKQAKKYSN